MRIVGLHTATGTRHLPDFATSCKIFVSEGTKTAQGPTAETKRVNMIAFAMALMPQASQ